MFMLYLLGSYRYGARGAPVHFLLVQTWRRSSRLVDEGDADEQLVSHVIDVCIMSPSCNIPTEIKTAFSEELTAIILFSSLSHSLLSRLPLHGHNLLIPSSAINQIYEHLYRADCVRSGGRKGKRRRYQAGWAAS
jgi:hypothetical protein